jgi:hypothetical protein
MSGGTGNLVVKVRPMMASAELLEAWLSSGKADLVSDKANEVIRSASGVI